jgi:4-hydroxy-3-polyprenylbenzoate decarboxylase
MPERIVIGMSGSSGSPYGIRLLELLKPLPEYEVHLVMTSAARTNVEVETDRAPADVEALADVVHDPADVGASIASGSFRTIGMIVAPCSMKTLSGIVNCYADNLLLRAADVVLKERRRLVVMPRETPLHVGHTRLMYEASQMGVIVCPPTPSFYGRPKTIDDLVSNSAGRALALFDIDVGVVSRWTGL